jgi:hypothetical protein
MPSSSKKQRNFMAAAAHNPAFAKKVGIPTKVAKEFNQADKGKKFNGGGMAKENSKMDMAQDKKMAKKAIGMHDKQMHGGKKTDLAALKKGGGVKKMAMGGMGGGMMGAIANKMGAAPAGRMGGASKLNSAKKMARGGGIEVRGKTRGKMC